MKIINKLKTIIKRNKQSTAHENEANLDVITFDEIKIQRKMANGQIESIDWDKIEEIRIITSDRGPLVDDLFWVMIGANQGCAAPSESNGIDELIKEFQKLPGFNNAEVIKAMTSTENANFMCWKKT